jgi:hypothetical protein
MGPSITGPILHGPTTQHSHTGHLQLAQQLTGVMGHSSSGLTLFGPSALHFYQGPSSAGLSFVPPNPLPLPNSLISRSIHVSLPIPSSSPLPHMMFAGSMDSPMHAPHPTSHSHPINTPSQIYTNPIISLPPSPVQPYTTNSPNLFYPTAPLTHKLSSHSSRSTTCHQPYQKKGNAATSKGKSQLEDTYPSTLSEFSKTSGQKRMVVLEVSDLFPIPSKKLATSSSYQDRMLLAAHSLSALRNSPPTPTTPVFPTAPLVKDFAPFSVTHSSYAESSPTARVETMGFPTVPMSPTLGRRVYKAAKKSRSVTQLILMDAGSHAVATTSAQIEAAGLAMPPLDI